VPPPFISIPKHATIGRSQTFRKITPQHTLERRYIQGPLCRTKFSENGLSEIAVWCDSALSFIGQRLFDAWRLDADTSQERQPDHSVRHAIIQRNGDPL